MDKEAPIRSAPERVQKIWAESLGESREHVRFNRETSALTAKLLWGIRSVGGKDSGVFGMVEPVQVE